MDGDAFFENVIKPIARMRWCHACGGPPRTAARPPQSGGSAHRAAALSQRGCSSLSPLLSQRLLPHHRHHHDHQAWGVWQKWGCQICAWPHVKKLMWSVAHPLDMSQKCVEGPRCVQKYRTEFRWWMSLPFPVYGSSFCEAKCW